MNLKNLTPLPVFRNRTQRVLNGSCKLLSLNRPPLSSSTLLCDFSMRVSMVKLEMAVKVSGKFCLLVPPHWISL